MGGKSDPPPAPDYSALAQASEKSATYAYELAKRQQDWAEKTYTENKGVSDLVIEQALGQSRHAVRHLRLPFQPVRG